MPKLIVTTRDGGQESIEGEAGLSVMELIRRSDISDLLALCGGSCSCATCHIFVDPAHANLVGPPGSDEDELLGTSIHRRSNSRLACQIRFYDKLDGVKVTIAPEDE